MKIADNGVAITLGLAGIVAAAGALVSRRGSRASVSNILYWGARVAEPAEKYASRVYYRVPLSLSEGATDDAVGKLRAAIAKKSDRETDYILESVTQGTGEGAPAGAAWTARVIEMAAWVDSPEKEDGPRIGERRRTC